MDSPVAYAVLSLGLYVTALILGILHYRRCPAAYMFLIWGAVVSLIGTLADTVMTFGLPGVIFLQPGMVRWSYLVSGLMLVLGVVSGRTNPPSPKDYLLNENEQYYPSDFSPSSAKTPDSPDVTARRHHDS